MSNEFLFVTRKAPGMEPLSTIPSTNLVMTADPTTGEWGKIPFDNFVSQIEARVRRTMNPLGKRILYNKTSWADLTDFTAVGFTPTVVGNKIRFGAGVNDYTSQYMDVNGFTNCDENIEVEVKFKYLSTVGSQSFGITVGKGSLNPFFPVSISVQSVPNTVTNKIDSYIFRNAPTVIASSLAQSTIPSTGDEITIRFKQSKNVLSLRSDKNGTNFANVSISDVFAEGDGSGINQLTPNASKIRITNVGSTGSVEIQSIKITTFSDVPYLVFHGDSKTRGEYATDISLTYPELIDELTGYNVLNYSGTGDTTVETLAVAPYLVGLGAKKVVLNMGRNDIAHSIDYTIKYPQIVTAYENAGMKVIHLLPIPEASLNQSALKAYILANFDNTMCIDPSVGFINGTMLSADGVHLTPVGMVHMRDVILNSTLIT